MLRASFIAAFLFNACVSFTQVKYSLTDRHFRKIPVVEMNFPERIQFAYRLANFNDDWSFTDFYNRNVVYTNLPLGQFFLQIKTWTIGQKWQIAKGFSFSISPPFWQTWWFRILEGLAIAGALYYFFKRRINEIRTQERQKAAVEKQMLELEAKALRAQMNPHFIFNCLNSIKSLIQQSENEKSITYLTTFSKLIRTLLNNADKKDISLYDEIDTCKLYLQLEAMRFDAKFSYAVNVEGNIDLKSIQIPALIVQPFIENAIWHGRVPRNTGGKVSLDVVKKHGLIEVVVEDNGIGRESSQQNKSSTSLAHNSKGVNLTQSRLELDNLLQQRQAKLEIIDKKDEKNMGTGTVVIIKIKEELI